MTGKMRIFDVEYSGHTLIVTPQGNLYEYRYNELRDAYNDVYRMISDDSARHLLFDFVNLTRFGSAFIGIMIRLSKKIRNGGGNAGLCNLSDDMSETLRTMLLLDNIEGGSYWTGYSSREVALAALES